MKDVTVYEQDRKTFVDDLPDPKKHEILAAVRDAVTQKDVPDIDRRVNFALDQQVEELEALINIHYVDKTRDLSKVQPIKTEQYFIGYSREKFQPLLEALSKGDFELAERLTPEGFRLCGYQEFKTPHTEQEYARGWAGQYADTVIPPGVYPVFVSCFACHGDANQYTNQVLDFNGIYTWMEGECISASDERKIGASHVVSDLPYAHSVARDILSGTGNICLLYPFQPQEVHFQFDGEARTSYKIIDSRLPDQLSVDPMRLRLDKDLPRPTLKDQIRSAAEKTSVQATKETPRIER